MIRIDREDDGRRGRFVIYEDELYAGEMTYEWQDARTIIVPVCSFVRKSFERDASLADVKA